jgi:hypothetical protein
LSLEDIRSRVLQVGRPGSPDPLFKEWKEVVRFSSRVDELLAGQDHRSIFNLLLKFARAYFHTQDFNKGAVIYLRCAEACGALEFFDIQMKMVGEAVGCLVEAGDCRIDEVVEGRAPVLVASLLEGLARKFEGTKKYDEAANMYVRLADSGGVSKRFSQQVDGMKRAARCFKQAGKGKTGILWLERARDVSAEHAFVAKEAKMCMQLGEDLTQERKFGQGVQELRRALALVPRVGEDERASLERAALRGLVEALSQHGQLEEAQAVLNRLRKAGDTNAACRLWNHYLRGFISASESIHGHSSDSGLSAAAEKACMAFQAAQDVAGKHPEVLQDPRTNFAFTKAKTLQERMRGGGDAPSISAIMKLVEEAERRRDWPEVLRWESRLEDLLVVAEVFHPWLLHTFARANFAQGHFAKSSSLYQRRVQVLGNLERFSDAGKAMCDVGDCFHRLDDAEAAETWYLKAQNLGAQHGRFALECRASLGLAKMEWFLRRRSQEAEELFRHALTVVDFVEGDEVETFERDISLELAKMLMTTGREEEAGPLIQRLRELAGTAGAAPLDTVVALQLAVAFQTKRGTREETAQEIQVLPSDPRLIG